jgi:hypothetical protein
MPASSRLFHAVIAMGIALGAAELTGCVTPPSELILGPDACPNNPDAAPGDDAATCPDDVGWHPTK